MDPSGTYSFAAPNQAAYSRDAQQQQYSQQNQLNGDNAYNDGVNGGYSDAVQNNDNNATSTMLPPTNSLTGGIPQNMDSDETAYLYANPLKDEETDDGRVRNQEAAMKIKDAWIYKQIQARQVGLLLYFFSKFNFCDYKRITISNYLVYRTDQRHRFSFRTSLHNISR